MACPECGNLVAVTDQFCPKCFARLEPPGLWRKFLSLFQTAHAPRRPLITIKKTVDIRTTDKDGVKHEYHSLDEVPPEMRDEIKKLESEALTGRGRSTSITESSREGNAISSHTLIKQNVSIYRIKDAAGNERVYHSLDGVPPEIRRAIERAQGKMD
jgi:hypothetical protein